MRNSATIDAIDQPALIIDLARHELVAANQAARVLWGLDQTTNLPLALASDMPALTALNQFTKRNAPVELVFWTQRGSQLLRCIELTVTKPDHILVVAEDVQHAHSSKPDSRLDDTATEPRPMSQNIDIGTMAHELRTPLGAIVALAEMIEKEQFGPLGDARYAAYAKDIGDSARLTLAIVAGALEQGTVAGQDHSIVSFQELDVAALVERSLRAIRPSAETAGLTLTYQRASGLPHLIADAAALTQILLNFLSNAIKFTPQGGQITVQCTVGGDGSLTVSVRDTGLGMSLDSKRVLASDIADEGNPPRATTADGPTVKRGIGFALVRRLAAMMSASLEVESERGLGTCVSLTFPPSKVIPVVDATELANAQP